MTESTLSSAIEAAAQSFLSGLSVDSFQTLSDKVIDGCMKNLMNQVNGHAAAVWVHQSSDEGEVLTIAYNIGEKGRDVEGVVSQSLDSGLVSKAYKDLETICHQGFFKHKEQSAEVDKELGQITAHQIAAPFQLFGQTVGAITVIQTLATGVAQQSEWGFDESDVSVFKDSAEAIQRLFELNAIRSLS